MDEIDQLFEKAKARVGYYLTLDFIVDAKTIHFLTLYIKL